MQGFELPTAMEASLCVRTSHQNCDRKEEANL